VLGTIRKPSARRGAQALFRGIWTNVGKVNEFQSFSMNKKNNTYIVLVATRAY